MKMKYLDMVVTGKIFIRQITVTFRLEGSLNFNSSTQKKYIKILINIWYILMTNIFLTFKIKKVCF